MVYTWMMVNRICLHPDTSPEFEGQLDATRSVAIADATLYVKSTSPILSSKEKTLRVRANDSVKQ